jgi:hypothetical protein
MTPELLAQYLDTLRARGAQSAHLKLPVAFGDTIMQAELAIVFEPNTAPLPLGDEMTPGGWKGPEHLDEGMVP